MLDKLYHRAKKRKANEAKERRVNLQEGRRLERKSAVEKMGEAKVIESGKEGGLRDVNSAGRMKREQREERMRRGGKKPKRERARMIQTVSQ